MEADVDWTVSGLPDWLKLAPQQGEAGKTTVTLETLTENATAQTRKAELAFTSPSDAGLKTILTVHQQSNVILPPSGLSVRVTEEGGIGMDGSARGYSRVVRRF